MKTNDQILLEQAYQKIIESSLHESSLETSSLRDPSLTDKQAATLIAKQNKLKTAIKSIKDKMALPHYKEEYGPHDQVDDAKALKDLESKLRQVRKQYYGSGF